MGAIRFLLAITVVINHTGPLFGLVFTDAYIAIKLFFIISGFYMSLILSEKYVGPGSYRLFITNRFLRLFPAYWMILALALAVSLFFRLFLDSSLLLSPWFLRQDYLNPVSSALLILANLSIFGQDILFFMGLAKDTGALYFDANALLSPQPAWFFLLIPQAWTLSLELTFYLLAPFLVRRRLAVLLILAGAGFALRYYIYRVELPIDPWEQRFFPAEFGFFILGILCHRFYARITTRAMRPWLPKAVTLGFLGYLAVYQFLPGGFAKELFTYGLAIFTLPYAFVFTKYVTWDRTIGELSYPIYISHWLIIVVLRYYYPQELLPVLSVAVTVAFCFAFNVFFSDRIERYRQKRVLAAS